MLVLGEGKQRRGRDRGNMDPTPRCVCSRGHFRGWVVAGRAAQELALPLPGPAPRFTTCSPSHSCSPRSPCPSLCYSLREGEQNPSSSFPLTDVPGPHPQPLLEWEPRSLLVALPNIHRTPLVCCGVGLAERGFLFLAAWDPGWLHGASEPNPSSILV